MVGTPKGRLSKLEAKLLEQPWNSVGPGVEVKLLAQEGELYILAQSRQRIDKERAIRRRRLKKLWKRLAQLQQMHLSRDQLLIKLGQAKEEAGGAWKLVQITVDAAETAPPVGMLHYRLDKERLRVVRRREGRYLLRSNTQPEEDHRLLLDALKLQLPAQPKPRITAASKLADLS